MSGMQMMLLGSVEDSVVVNFVNATIYSGNASAATAAYRVNDDGFDYEGIQGVFTSLTQWVTPTSAGGNYEVFATVTSGTLSSGTTGSWVATNTDPTWTRVAAGLSTIQIVDLSMQVRKVGDATVLDTWTVNLTAERF